MEWISCHSKNPSPATPASKYTTWKTIHLQRTPHSITHLRSLPLQSHVFPLSSKNKKIISPTNHPNTFGSTPISKKNNKTNKPPFPPFHWPNPTQSSGTLQTFGPHKTIIKSLLPLASNPLQVPFTVTLFIWDLQIRIDLSKPVMKSTFKATKTMRLCLKIFCAT